MTLMCSANTLAAHHFNGRWRLTLSTSSNGGGDGGDGDGTKIKLHSLPRGKLTEHDRMKCENLRTCRKLVCVHTHRVTHAHPRRPIHAESERVFETLCHESWVCESVLCVCGFTFQIVWIYAAHSLYEIWTMRTSVCVCVCVFACEMILIIVHNYTL